MGAKMNRIFRNFTLILLALCLLLSLVACKEQEEEKPAGNGDFVAVADGAAQCRIVYPDGADALDWKSAANMLARLIKKLTGVAPTTASDSDPEEGREILIGTTNRTASATVLSGLDTLGTDKTAWIYAVSGNSFVIAARNPEQAASAITMLEAQLEALHISAASGSMTIPAGLSFTYVKPETVISGNEPWALFGEANTKDTDASFLSAEQLFKVYTKMKETFGITAYLCMQGACTDGTYAYFFMDNTVEDVERHYNYIVKVDLATGEFVKISEKLNLGHANDACYNPDTGTIVVACNAPDKERICFVNPETLEMTGEKHLSLDIFAIAYNTYTGQYVVGISGGRNFALLDADFNVLKKRNTDYSSYDKDVIYTDYDGTNAEILTQGIDCDGKYVYFVLSGHPKKADGTWSSVWTNYLVVFDYEGRHQFTKTLPGPTYEVENMFHVGKTVYFTCHSWKGDPCFRLDVKAE